MKEFSLLKYSWHERSFKDCHKDQGNLLNEVYSLVLLQISNFEKVVASFWSDWSILKSLRDFLNRIYDDSKDLISKIAISDVCL